MGKTEVSERVWIAISAMAAAWTPPDAGPDVYAAALGRALVVYMGARKLTTGRGFPVYVESTHVLTLVAGDGMGIALDAD